MKRKTQKTRKKCCEPNQPNSGCKCSENLNSTAIGCLQTAQELLIIGDTEAACRWIDRAIEKIELSRHKGRYSHNFYTPKHD